MTISMVYEIPEAVSNNLTLFVQDNPETCLDEVVSAAIVAYLKAQEATNA